MAARKQQRRAGATEIAGGVTAPSAGLRALCASAAVFLALAAGCVVAPVRHHYPRNAGEVDGAIDRLELTIRCAAEEGASTEPHSAALRAVDATRAALDQDPIDEPVMAAALDEAAALLDRAAREARAGQTSVKPAPPPEGRTATIWDPMAQRDRLFDLENQCRRAAREVRALRRAIAG